jgi:hypothetical protein
MAARIFVRPLLQLAAFLTLLSFFLTAACSSDPSCDPEHEYCGTTGDPSTVIVVGQGTGSGLVINSILPVQDDLSIDCAVPGNATHHVCTDDFTPLSTGGYVQLEAIADGGSVFAGWFSGCSRIETGINGEFCLIDYSGLAGPITYTVTARFNLAGATNTVMLYNASSVSAYLVGPSESPGNPGTLVESHGPARSVSIPTTVGSQATFSAYFSVGTAAVATITCMVTATAWQNGTQPLVTFNNSEGNFLTCSDGLVAP